MADEEHFSRRSLLALLGGAGAAVVGRQGDALAAALGAPAREEAPAETATAGEQTEGTGALPLAQPVLDAGPGQPPIIARRAWAGNGCPPVRAPEYGTVEMAFVHHTDNPNGYSPAEVPALLRAIYVYHRYGRGWNDIGYNFVIDRFGRIFEARAGGIDEPVIGAQAGGYNGFSTGVALLGDFEAIRICTAARQALQRLLAWKLSLHGAPVEGELTVHCEPGGAVYSRFPANAAVQLNRVSGHRQADATTCPGNALYGQLREVRRLAAKLAGRPASVTLELEPGSPVPGEAGAEGERVHAVSGALAFLDGTPIPEAPIEIQVREDSEHGEQVEERTIATTSTDAEGAFSVALTVTPDPSRPKSKKSRKGGQGSGGEGGQGSAAAEHLTSLRALCPGAEGVPASVSAPLVLAAKVSAKTPG